MVYIGEKGSRFTETDDLKAAVDETQTIFAGKLRRYHGQGIKQLLDIPTLLKNIRDAFFTTIGIVQSIRLLKRLRPSVVFIRGGFVGVPVGLAAAWLKIPYITHDSDALPSLANRLVARWAVAHAVAMPKETYKYPAGKTFQVGVPISRNFVRVNDRLQAQYRQELELEQAGQVIFVTGGGLGAVRLNNAIGMAAPALLERFPGLHLLHVVGRGNELRMHEYYGLLDEEARSRVRVMPFVKDLYRYSGAADVVVTRGGATALAEFAAQGKACVIVPNPMLTGGHQLKNAQTLADMGAARVVDERSLITDAGELTAVLENLLKDQKQRQQLGAKLRKLARPDSDEELARLIMDQAAAASKGNEG